MVAGISAALFIATDPLFVENSRDLRGYSLAALCSLLGTLLLIDERRTRLRLLAYGLLMGLAIAAHVFAIVVLAGHFVWIAARRSTPALMQLIPAWLLASVIGVAANANIEYMELVQHGFPPSLFNPTFPLYLVLFLLGAPVVLAMGLWLSAAGLGVWVLRDEPRLWASVAVVAAVVAVLWLGLQPAYLYPRFFIFLIPGCAFLMAVAIQRWKVLAPVVVL
jgi:mannosyltransferase